MPVYHRIVKGHPRDALEEVRRATRHAHATASGAVDTDIAGVEEDGQLPINHGRME